MPKRRKDIIVTESTNTYNEAEGRGHSKIVSFTAYGGEDLMDRVGHALREIWREAAAEGKAFDYHLCYVAIQESETMEGTP
jgi:hypothetical protein